VYAEENLYTCSQDTQDKIKNLILEKGLNRVVVASCSPRTHEPLFQETIRQAGLNPHLFEMANIRDQCSWVHMSQKELATEKSKDLLRMAVAKVRDAAPLHPIMLDVNHDGLVVGGGVAGMSAALALADQGFNVSLVEKSDKLGGRALELDLDIEGRNVPKFIADLVARVKKNEQVHVWLKSTLAEVSGFLGNYESTIETHSRKKAVQTKVKHGVAIIATGGEESKPLEYGYGRGSMIMTQMGLEKKLGTGKFKPPQTTVMIQCVGSREGEHMYCSRLCCTQAVKNAIRIKESQPDAEVYILYRDVRTYGFLETLYEKARELGVQFIKFNLDGKPKVAVRGKTANVIVFDALLGQEITIPANLLVLSSRIDPGPDNEKLATLFKVPLNNERFFLEAHVKLRPVDFATEGVFVCGLAHYPKNMSESISQALAAAARAATVLSKEKIEAEPRVSVVREDRCSGCGACIEVCAYHAIEMDLVKGVAKISEGVCKGCGACSATCRCGAIDVRGFRDSQILEVLKTF